MSFMFARCDREAANGANDRRITELRLSRDDRVGDEVVNGLIHALRFSKNPPSNHNKCAVRRKCILGNQQNAPPA